MKNTTVAAIALGLLMLTIAYRLLTLGGPLGGFENDQFVTLSQAQQVVMGDWPMRDFVELGMPLTVLLSATGQVMLGHTLLAEALLMSSVIGICTAVLFWLSWRASGSLVLALVVALIQVAMAPRFYNSPKLLAYAIAMRALWWYIDRPDRRRLALVAVAGVVAFLLRHDHGLYVGLAAIAAVALVHRRRVRTMARETALLGTMAFAMVVPYLLFLQLHGGLVPYFQSFVRYANQSAERTAFRGAPMSFDWSRPLVVRVPAPERTPRVNVRWAGGVTGARRAERERALGLIDPEPRSADVVNYELTDASIGGVAAIIRDPAVADTAGIDRQTFVLNDSFYTHVPTGRERAVAYVRSVRLLPGIFQSGNAIPFLYYLMYAVPMAAFFIAFLRGDTKIIVLAVLALLIDRGFLRGNLDSRLADVTEVVGVLAAFVAAAALARRSRYARIAAAAILLLVFAATVWSVEAVEHVSTQLAQTGVTTGWRSIRTRATDIHTLLTATPAVGAWPPDTPGMERVAHYVSACTAPDDRVLAIGYMPELFFMAGRRFAAGNVWIVPDFFTSAADQQLMIDRLHAFRVPIVITAPEPAYSQDYVESFPRLTATLQSEYRELKTVDFGRGFRYRVLVRRDLTPSSTYAFDALPCFS